MTTLDKTVPSPARPPETPFALDTFLPYRLAVAAEAVSRGLAAVYSERFGLTIPEWRVLANLGHHGPMTAGEAAERSSLDKVQVTRAMQRLQARRLISRRQGVTDRRHVHLALTRAGERMVEEIVPLAEAWERDLLATMPERLQRALNEALEHLTTSATAGP